MSKPHTIEIRTAPAERIASLIEGGTPLLLAQIYAAQIGRAHV